MELMIRYQNAVYFVFNLISIFLAEETSDEDGYTEIMNFKTVDAPYL